MSVELYRCQWHKRNSFCWEREVLSYNWWINNTFASLKKGARFLVDTSKANRKIIILFVCQAWRMEDGVIILFFVFFGLLGSKGEMSYLIINKECQLNYILIKLHGKIRPTSYVSDTIRYNWYNAKVSNWHLLVICQFLYYSAVSEADENQPPHNSYSITMKFGSICLLLDTYTSLQPEILYCNFYLLQVTERLSLNWWVTAVYVAICSIIKIISILFPLLIFIRIEVKIPS